MKKKDFNRGWLFGAVGKEQSMQPVTLPHDAMLYEKRSKDAATAGACGHFTTTICMAYSPFQVCKPYYAAGAGNVTRQRGSKSQDHGRFGSKVQLQVR